MTTSDRPAPMEGDAASAGLTPDDIRIAARHAARADRRHPWHLVGRLDGAFLDLWADRTGVTARIRDEAGTRAEHLTWRDLDRRTQAPRERRRPPAGRRRPLPPPRPNRERRMIDLPATLRRWHTASRARRALVASLYGDDEPARRLTEASIPHGPARLAQVAAVWVDSYLADTPKADRELIAPLDRWLGELIHARANRNGDVFRKLLGELREPLVWLHLRELLALATNARLDREDGMWP